MYKRGFIVKHIILGVNNVAAHTANFFCTTTNGIKIDKVLVVTKLSRYELEKNKLKHLSDKEVNEDLKRKGFNLDKLLYYDKQNRNFQNKVITTLNDMGIEVQVTNKSDYTREKVDWADLILPAGGDGTFLLASSRVRDSKKPVVGFNSDPHRSEGYLCLPKKCSAVIKESIEKLREGRFKWLMRNRIRTTLTGLTKCIYPKHLYNFDENCDAIVDLQAETESMMTKDGQVLPALALNEVFIGEIFSARASHLDVYLDNVGPTGVKCSGICISTGTGSSSWHFSMNRLSAQTVKEMLELINYETEEPKQKTAVRIAREFNKRLIFPADSGKMVYTIRDFITAGVWPNPKGIGSRSFAKKISVTSYCIDATLVIDGGMSFEFNNGVSATLEIYPEDALRTVILSD